MIIKYNPNTCAQCGVCSGNCPLFTDLKLFSPRIAVYGTSIGYTISKDFLKQCLTCAACYTNCPMQINLPEAVREERAGLKEDPFCFAHKGFFHFLDKIMMSNKIWPRLKIWLPSGYKTSENNDIGYFIGCLPYLDIFFKDIGFDGKKIVQDALSILNKLGIEPVLLRTKCCGHDAFWRGEYQIFENLAKQNIEMIKASGVKKIITTCAECYRTLKIDYEKFDFNIEVLFISEFLEKHFPNLRFKPSEIKIGYHDSCRLGRHLNVYDSPREIIKAIAGTNFTEIMRRRENSLCCGVSAWMNCDENSKLIRTQKINDARKAKVESLIVPCPKCNIHLNCLLSEEAMKNTNLKVQDLTSFISSHFEGLR